jgi:hypothetical protein
MTDPWSAGFLRWETVSLGNEPKMVTGVMRGEEGSEEIPPRVRSEASIQTYLLKISFHSLIQSVRIFPHSSQSGYHIFAFSLGVIPSGVGTPSKAE